jgi:primosomal protein N'
MPLMGLPGTGNTRMPPPLTAEQSAAVETVCAAVGTAPRVFVIEAVAGSGKTHTLVALVDAVMRTHKLARVLCLQFDRQPSLSLAGRGPSATRR